MLGIGQPQRHREHRGCTEKRAFVTFCAKPHKANAGRSGGKPLFLTCSFIEKDQFSVGKEQGSKAKQPNGKLNDYAIKMPTASSSGRETEKRLQ